MVNANLEAFLFRAYFRDANSPGGERRRELLVLARSKDEAFRIVPGRRPELLEAGAAIRKRAEELSMGITEVRFID